MLAACAGGAIDLHFNVFRADLHIHGLHLGQHSHSSGGGMNAAAGLGLGHTLDAVDAGFELHSGEGAVALNDEIRLLYAAKLGLVIVQKLQPPTLGRGVHGIHPKQAVGKQRALLAADAAADLNNDVFLVVGIPGQKQHSQLFGKRLGLFFCRLVFLLAKVLHFRLKLHQLKRLVHCLPRGLVGPEGLHHRLKLALLFHRAGCGLGIGIEIRLLAAGLQLFISVFHLG